MPIDKQAVLNSTGKPSTSNPVPSTQATPEENTALAVLSQTAAGTLRQSIGAMTQLAEKLEDQRTLVTDHAAERVAAILDPHSIQAEIAIKTLNQLEGKTFLPFDLERIELPEVPRYVPQLPQSFASQPFASLPSSTIDAQESEITCNGKSNTAAGKGFGVPRNDS